MPDTQGSIGPEVREQRRTDRPTLRAHGPGAARRAGSVPGLHRLGALAATLLLVASAVPSPVGAAPAGTTPAKAAAVGAPATHSISGTVRSATGAPLAGIAVSTVIQGGSAATADVTVTSTTAAGGRYVLAGLPSGGYPVRFADPAGGTHVWYSTDSATGVVLGSLGATGVTVADADVTGIDIRYPNTYAVTATVTTSDGTPLVGAGVVVVPQEGDCGTCEPPFYAADATTGTGGTFSVHLLAGDYAFGFLPTASAPRVVAHWAAWVTVAGDVTGLKIALKPTSLVRGRITGPKTGYRYSVVGCPTPSWPPPEDWSTSFHACDGIWTAAATGATVRYTIAAYAGRTVLLFGGPSSASPQGGLEVLPGYWSRSGLVPTPDRATPLDLDHGDASGIDVTLQPLAIGIHAGTSARGSFGGGPVTVAVGSMVTLRVRLPRTFVGMTVDIQGAALGATGKPGAFSSLGKRTVAADGTMVWTATIRRSTAFRAQYMGDYFTYGGVAYGTPDPPVLSAVVMAKVR